MPSISISEMVAQDTWLLMSSPPLDKDYDQLKVLLLSVFFSFLTYHSAFIRIFIQTEYCVTDESAN